MKILQILPEMTTGGVEFVVLDLVVALRERNHHAIVVCDGGELLDKVSVAGGVHVPLEASTKNPLRILWNAKCLEKIIKQHDIDLIHAHSRAPAWSAYLAAQKTKIPFVTTYHGIYNENFPGKRWYNSVMARGTHVVANSQYTKKHILARYSLPEHKISVIHIGNDMVHFSQRSVHEDRVSAIKSQWFGEGERLDSKPTIILHLARLTRWKGQFVLIEVAEQMIATGFDNFIIVMAGSEQKRAGYKQSLKEEIKRRKLGNHILLVGNCEDPAAAMKSADIVVVPSIEAEAFGRAAVEAQSMEKAVIVSDLGAVSETVLSAPFVHDDNITGWCARAGDVDQWSAIVNTVCHMQKSAIEEIGARARRHVMKNFSLQKMVTENIALYEKLLSSR